MVCNSTNINIYTTDSQVADGMNQGSIEFIILIGVTTLKILVDQWQHWRNRKAAKQQNSEILQSISQEANNTRDKLQKIQTMKVQSVHYRSHDIEEGLENKLSFSQPDDANSAGLLNRGDRI